MPRNFLNLSLVLSVFAAFVSMIGFRLAPQQRQVWFVPVPVEVGPWTTAEVPPPPSAVEQLGNADVQGWVFTNLFGENVEVQIIATDKYGAYLDPVDTMQRFGYTATAQKRIPLFGKNGQQGSVRSLVFTDVRENRRVLMYYWQQYADGTTRADTSGGYQNDPLARLRIGVDTVLTATPSCLVRMYIPIHAADFKAIQARRNLNEVAQALQASAQAQAGGKPVLPKPAWLTSRLSPQESGTDMSYLTTRLTDFPASEKNKVILPLATGNWWDMESYITREKGEPEKHRDRSEVVGPTNIDGKTCTEVRILRDGKPFRRELYRRDGDTVYLVGAQDENAGLMRYQPAVPMIKYPLTEGQTLTWKGTFLSGKARLAARSLSRISGRETLQTPSGPYRCLRVDTLIAVTPPGRTAANEIRFPTVRWLSPNVGFVRRAFVDKGRPAYSEVTRFKVR